MSTKTQTQTLATIANITTRPNPTPENCLEEQSPDNPDQPEPPESPAKCTFLTLPGEVRNQIYAELLVYRPTDPEYVPGPIRLFRDRRNRTNCVRALWGARDGFDHRGSTRPSPIHTAILLTSRRVHAEAASVLYGGNMFRCESTRSYVGARPGVDVRAEVAADFVVAVGLQNAAWLRGDLGVAGLCLDGSGVVEREAFADIEFDVLRAGRVAGEGGWKGWKRRWGTREKKGPLEYETLSPLEYETMWKDKKKRVRWSYDR